MCDFPLRVPRIFVQVCRIGGQGWGLGFGLQIENRREGFN